MASLQTTMGADFYKFFRTPEEQEFYEQEEQAKHQYDDRI